VPLNDSASLLQQRMLLYTLFPLCLNNKNYHHFRDASFEAFHDGEDS
jgi:hypothetical protein